MKHSKGKQQKARNRNAWVGVGLAALAAGAVVGLTGGWPFKGRSGATGSSEGGQGSSETGSDRGAGTKAGITADESGASAGGGATADVDVALTNG